MPLITDIPERDGLDGAAQLALLRSYLKDSVVPYVFPDDLLIPLLVNDDRVIVWRNITGEPDDSIPWSYDPLLIQDPITRIRVLTTDVVELSLKYTDAELLDMLEVIPLRYVISMLNAREADSTTYPADKNNPITVLRDLLLDTDITAAKYTDKELIDALIESGLDPYGYALTVFDKEISNNTAGGITTPNSFVSIDGISFGSSIDSEMSKASARMDIISAFSSSAYWKEDTFTWYVDQEEPYKRSWEVKWYAL